MSAERGEGPPKTPRKQSDTQASDEGAALSSAQSDGSRGGVRPASIGEPAAQANVSMFTGERDKVSMPSSAFSQASDGPLSSNTQDRVFPIRSVVSVDPTATPMPRPSSDGGFPGMSVPPEATAAAIARQDQRRQSIRSNSPAQSSTPRGGPSRSNTNSDIASQAEAPPPGINRNQSTHHQNLGPELQNLASAMMGGDDASLRSEAGNSTDGGVSVQSQRASMRRTSNPQIGLLTARFKHVVTEGGHAVITGRDGETLQRCEDEPIHMPGAIQSFGLLIALREEAGKLVVRIVSENSKNIIGYSPEQLFSLDNFLDILTDEQADNLLDHLDFIRDEDATDPAVNGPEVFMLSIRSPRRRTQNLWCGMHIIPSNSDLIVCEFELEDDAANPLVPPGEGTLEPPEDILGSNPSPEELAESTINMSRPLRVLRSARKKKGEAAAMEVFNIMSQVQEQLAGAPDLDVFLKVLIGVVKELTGFHRVMIYQFDPQWNGRVVAELLDPRATKDLYKGLHFPASDIPKQARDLYKVNKVRLLYDRDQETSRLVCRTVEDLETPLDMTYAYLRAMSPIHIKYLENMSVRSSMSISINAFDQLWGLISCHTYGSKGMRVSFPIRKMCRLVGDTASRNIERLSYASRLQARKLINTMPTEANPSGYIVASSEDLLKLFEADIGALSIRDETKILGNPENHMQEVLAMLEFMRLRKLHSVFATQDVTEDFPDMRYQPGFKFIAGLLYVPLSLNGDDFIIFFRRGQLREVKWAGNPYEKFVKEGTEGYLEPRKSFKTWSETIVGKCREWKEQEIETAAVLCLVYGKFIEVWRQKEQALQSSQLTRLLLANSAHEVRTPLNAIINYLEIALEGSLDQETRENLSRSHSASKSLIYVINDLLDLTKTEEGQELLKGEVFDLPATLHEASDMFSRDAKRKNLEYVVQDFSRLPKQVVGDQRKVRQVLSNIIANAIQYTTNGSVKVEAWMAETQPEGQRFDIEIVITDTGTGMAPGKVDALFRDLEQVSFDGNEPILEGDPITSKTIEQRRTLGLGLAVVARALRNMNGQLRLKSEEGKGCRFLIILGFELPQDSERPKSRDAKSDINKPETPVTPPHVEGEIMLINRSAQKRSTPPPPPPRRESTESVASLRSVKSQNSVKSRNSMTSQKSDVDKLIEAIQEPFSLSDADLTRPPPRATSARQNSHNSVKFSGGRSSRPGSAGAESSPIRERNIIGPLTSFSERKPGQEQVADSRTPITPVRIPDDERATSPTPSQPENKVLFEVPKRAVEEETPLKPDHFSVLVAEDDPINSKIIKKRLEKAGHKVQLTVNGEECATAHGEAPSTFDVVLMDLQVRWFALIIYCHC